MRAVRGVVTSTKRASLSEAATFAAAFAATAAGEEARPDVAAYIRRFRSALDELVLFHREIDPHGGGQVEDPRGGVEGEVADAGARVLGSEETRRGRKKKKKKRKREEVDGERSGFHGDLGHVRTKKKKKKNNEEKEKS